MKLTQIAAKPKLVKIELNDEDIIKEYNEPLEFWIYDRQPMSKFIKLANSGNENYEELVNIVEALVLDEQGTPIIKDGVLLPTMIMTKVVTKVVDVLGK